jgi:hypothetical protein
MARLSTNVSEEYENGSDCSSVMLILAYQPTLVITRVMEIVNVCHYAGNEAVISSILSEPGSIASCLRGVTGRSGMRGCASEGGWT